jgi:hypothetical protein
MNKPMIIQSEAERRAKIIKRAYSILPVISLSCQSQTGII